MKKMFLVLIATILAIGFSAFTPAKTGDTYLYLDDFGEWQLVPTNNDVSTLCPAGSIMQCVLFIDGVGRPIFKADHTPYMRN